MTEPWDGKMWVHCGRRLRVGGGQGADFKTLEACPAGLPEGMTPQELYERCVSCPAARRERARREAEMAVKP